MGRRGEILCPAPGRVLMSRSSPNGGISMAINYVAVFVAAIASWLVGAVWYTVLGKQWMNALGWGEDGMKNASGRRSVPAGPLIGAFVAQLVMAYLLSGAIGHVGIPGMRAGIISGALLWLGFTITAISVNNAFQKQKLMLTVIDGGHWLAVLVVQGAVIGYLG